MPDTEVDDAKRGKKKPFLLFAFVAAILAYLFISGHSPDSVRKMTAADFEQTRASNSVLVAYFTAEWCGPCKMQGPIVDKLASRFKAGVTVGKIDVDAEPALANSLDISSIPKIILFKGGREVARFRGVTEEAELAKAVQNQL